MFEILGKVMPIILLFSLGYFIRKKDLVSQENMDAIKIIILNLALPAVLFKTFVAMEFKIEYIMISFLIIILLYIMLLVGKVLNKYKGISHKINPYISTGFCFGLLGIPLFTIGFGEANLGVFSVIGLGHEIFAWCILYPILNFDLNNEKFELKQMVELLKSPIVLSILIGILFNLTGLKRLFFENKLFGGIYDTLEYLGSIATPLMLMIIGFGLKIQSKHIIQTLKMVLIRMVVTLGVGYLFKVIVINQLIEVTPIFNYAYLTFLILPPLYSLPIFVGASGTREDEELANNVVVVYTMLSLVLFVLIALLIAVTSVS